MITYVLEIYQDSMGRHSLIYNLHSDENPNIILYGVEPEADNYHYIIQQLHAEITGLV